MKYLIPVFIGGASITVTITTALVQARGAFNGHASLTPYLLIYGLALVLLLIAARLAVNAHRQERPPGISQALFVLEVEGSQPLGSSNSDWKFLLTNCATHTVRYVQLDKIRSEIGAYEIHFKEIPVLLPGQKAAVEYEVVSRRADDRSHPTLLDFGRDHAGERGNTYLWYDIPIRYRDAGDSNRDGAVAGVCFDLHKKILKTEGAEIWRADRAKWGKL